MLNHFNFKKIEQDTVLVTNDFGCYEFLTDDEFKALTTNSISVDSELYNKLRSKYFLLEPEDINSSEVVSALRGMKNYLFQSTALHIFVVTNRCNLNCIYCQAQDHSAVIKGNMNLETGKKAIDIALQSPNDNLTFEFQGGEPLLNFAIIKAMIEYAELNKGKKNIEYTVVSNFSLLTDEMIEFFLSKKVSICTSLDGPEELHCKNRRHLNSGNSYELLQNGLGKLRSHGMHAGAIQTTTRHSLRYPREIVREYLKQGLNSVFLRPLTPLGFAKTDWESIGYTPKEFMDFYKVAFDEILKLNKNGILFIEQHAVYFLRKILTGNSDNYMELRSPCGAGLGQLAYYYNGDIYTCDEARMVAEAGNEAFKLGNVFTSGYKELIDNKVCKATCSASILEAIPGCCDCAYHPYCGVCPVINYALYGNLFVNKVNEYRCQIYGGILEFLFDLLRNGAEEDIRILHSWAGDDNFEINH